MSLFSTVNPCHFQPARFHNPRNATQRVVVAVSACLVGEKVRYDGADRLLPASTLLRKELQLVAICPEMGAGLGVPRPPVQLISTNGQVRARGRERPDIDVTAELQRFAATSLKQLISDHLLCGYLWKSRSPSCGFGSTPLLSDQGTELHRTSGIQAEYFQRNLPYLNYCEETALATVSATRHFVLRCRLVSDLLHSPGAELPTLHRHYAFLHVNFDTDTVESLKLLSRTNNRTEYLVAFLQACNQIPENVLLDLFH